MRRCVLWWRAPGRSRGADRGAAAVEFALIMPILLLLVFGIISYGYMLSFRQAISQAAAEGARAAAVAQRDADQVPDALAAMNDALDSYGVACGDGTLTRDGDAVGSCAVDVATCAGEAASVQCVTVTIDYNYADNPLLPVAEGGQQRLLERQADRVEVRRVLGLRVDGDRPPQPPAPPLREVDDLLQPVFHQFSPALSGLLLGIFLPLTALPRRYVKNLSERSSCAHSPWRAVTRHAAS